MLRGAARLGLADIADKAARCGFKLLNQQSFSDYQVEVVTFEHKESGAQYIHVDADDTNNAFCVAFCTPPQDDTGVTHILEHTVLCGSEHYPVRDPFFKMRNRSLSTFMNAMTSTNCTKYPFATVNVQDYENLLSVYLDAVFFPTLSRMDFLQEGHRLDYDEVKEKFVIKGVVFNEMKGVYQDPSYLFYLRTLAESYGKNSVYGHHYGGDPLAIPGLTHAALRKYHEAHYCPGNSVLISYGDMDVGPCLEKVDAVLRRRLEKDGGRGARKQIVVHNDAAADAARKAKTLRSKGPADALSEGEGKQPARVSQSWVLHIDPSDTETLVAANILSNLLLQGANAPLYQSLIETSVASEFVSGAGFESDMKGAYWMIGVQGIDLEAHPAEKVVEIIRETLEKAEREGFKQERVESVLHQYELLMTHRPADWGTNVVTSLATTAVLGKSVFSVFEGTRHLSKFKEKLAADPKYLQSMIRTLLLDSNDTLVHVMEPDSKYTASLTNKEETELVPQLAKGVAKDDVKTQAKELAEEMDKKEDLSVLPTLNVDRDVPREPLPDPKIMKLEHPKVAYFQNIVTPTNGLWYFQALFPIGQLSVEELQLVPTLCSVVGNTGAGPLGYRELSEKIELCSGGISSGASVSADHLNPDLPRAYLALGSLGLQRSWDAFFDLLTDVLTRGNLDHTDDAVRLRVQNIITMAATEATDDIISNADYYALAQAAAQVLPVSHCKEVMQGVTQAAYLKSLMTSIQSSPDNLTRIIQQLEALSKKVLQSAGMKINVTSHDQLAEPNLDKLTALVNELPRDDSIPHVPTNHDLRAASLLPAPKSASVFIEAPTEIGYLAITRKTDLSYLHEDMAPVIVLLAILQTKFLHVEVREKGGAYGCGSFLDKNALVMYTHRDPSTAQSLKTFEKSLAWVTAGDNVTDTVINEAKLLAFASADAPKSPQDRGMSEFQNGITMADKKVFRSRLLAVSKEDVIAVAHKYLQPGWTTPELSATGRFTSAAAVVGGDKALAALNEDKSRAWQKWSHA
ncbi:Mitochondrial presequence protease [Diplonema papillatum]|nr:Mitochondrial presequence protease [Diplonema papillatum]